MEHVVFVKLMAGLLSSAESSSLCVELKLGPTSYKKKTRTGLQATLS